MRWLNASLNRQLAAATAAGLLISSLFFLVLFSSLFRGQLEREAANAAAQVTRLLQTSLENAMLKRDLEGLKGIVARLGAEPGVRAVLIANPAGEVRFASDPSSLGRLLASMPEASDLPRTRLLWDEGRYVLRTVTPVRNRQPCQECHGPIAAKPVNGVLFVDFDARPIRAKARATTLLLMGSGALIVVINIAGGWWFVHRLVLRPVSHLSEISRRISGGELDARARVSGHNELSLLGERFNRMAGAMQERLRELAEKESFLQGLVDAVPDGIRVIDEDYRVVLSNATYREQHGFRASDPVPERCYVASHGRDEPCPQTLTLCPVAELAARAAPLRAVHRHRRADGESLDVEIYAAPMRAALNGRPRRLVVESIRDLERQIRFSHEQRLSELGRLAAGVAHEIHNPLAAVRLALHAVERSAAQGPSERGRNSGAPGAAVSECLALVDQEVEKCCQVTERLLKLSMPPPSEPELVTVDRVVEDTLQLLDWEAGTLGVEVLREIEGAPLRVLASDSDLRMVTLNLVQNAFHAMPAGGALRVRCSRTADRGVSLVFEDTGVGIAPRDRVRIFEPFFSRRADGVRGTGLGLSIVKAIVEGHRGRVRVESEPGRGTRIAVELPDADAVAPDIED